jgi:hypothetical protein
MKPVIISIGLIVGTSLLLYFDGSPRPTAIRKTPDIVAVAAKLATTPGPLANGHTFSQTFIGQTDGLCSIEFLVATYQTSISPGAVTAVLVASTPRRRILASKEIEAASISDNHYSRFDFSPILQSKGVVFELLLTPHDLPPSAKFTVWLTAKSAYPGGASYVDRVPTGAGDLVLTASHSTGFLEIVRSFSVVFFVSLAIAVYLVAIGLAALMSIQLDSTALMCISPAVGIAVIGVISGIGVIIGQSRAVNLVGAVIILPLACISLFRGRDRLMRIEMPLLSIGFCVALIALCCAITSQADSIAFADPQDGPWRSFVPMYPADGIIPYESASIIANHLSPSEFLFEPKWQISDRTHLLTLLYLHFCQFFRIVPTHLPVGPWQAVDVFGFWLLRALAFATNSFVLLGVTLVGSMVLGRPGMRIAVALAAVAPFLILNVCYSWPKLLCAYLILVGIYFLLTRRFAWGGALFGLAYWAHPLAEIVAVGGLCFAWFIGADHRSSLRNVVRFAAMVLLAVGAGVGFNAAVFHLKGEALYLYPIDSGFVFHSGHDSEAVIRDFRATPLQDLLAIRLHNLAVFLWPSELGTVPQNLHPGTIWSLMKWKWYRVYLDSLWGAVGIIAFGLAAQGVFLSRRRRDIRLLGIMLIAVPSIVYVLWMGYLLDYNGFTFCQVVVPTTMIFAAIPLGSYSPPIATWIVTAVSLEMLFVLSIAYHDATVALGLMGLCVAAVLVSSRTTAESREAQRQGHLTTSLSGT